MLGNDRASAGSGGVGRGCTTLSGCSTAIECDAMDRKLPRRDRSHKPRREANGGAQCGKSACCVATWRGLETWYGRDALTNWRASPRPYRDPPSVPPYSSLPFLTVAVACNERLLRGRLRPISPLNANGAGEWKAVISLRGSPPEIGLQGCLFWPRSRDKAPWTGRAEIEPL